MFYRLLHEPHVAEPQGPSITQMAPSAEPTPSLDPHPVAVSGHRRKTDTAAAYLRLCRTNPGAMKRLGRYETALWRQVAQTLLMLETARSQRFPISKVISS